MLATTIHLLWAFHCTTFTILYFYLNTDFGKEIPGNCDMREVCKKIVVSAGAQICRSLGVQLKSVHVVLQVLVSGVQRA